MVAKHDPEFGQRFLGPPHKNVVILSEEFKGDTNDLMILPDPRMTDEDHIALFMIKVESLVNEFSWGLGFLGCGDSGSSKEPTCFVEFFVCHIQILLLVSLMQPEGRHRKL